jgi:hypothetical protein
VKDCTHLIPASKIELPLTDQSFHHETCHKLQTPNYNCEIYSNYHTRNHRNQFATSPELQERHLSDSSNYIIYTPGLLH